LGVDRLEIYTEGDWDMPNEEYEVCQVQRAVLES
jgi:hypothetical protein